VEKRGFWVTLKSFAPLSDHKKLSENLFESGPRTEDSLRGKLYSGPSVNRRTMYKLTASSVNRINTTELNCTQKNKNK
jgi:hypothetical protein